LIEESAGPAESAGTSAVSPDGRWRATGYAGDSVLLIDTARDGINRRFAREQLAALQRPDPAWHGAEADAAEKAGDAFATAFHLDRLAPLQPWDAGLHARRAAALARLGRGDQAAVAFLQAVFANPAFDFRTVKFAVPVAPPAGHPVEIIPPHSP
jgi:hypothetical protein